MVEMRLVQKEGGRSHLEAAAKTPRLLPLGRGEIAFGARRDDCRASCFRGAALGGSLRLFPALIHAT